MIINLVSKITKICNVAEISTLDDEDNLICVYAFIADFNLDAEGNHVTPYTWYQLFYICIVLLL